MKYLKALQKSEVKTKPPKRAKNVRQDTSKIGVLDAKVPDLLSDQNVTIGKPSADRSSHPVDTLGVTGTQSLRAERTDEPSRRGFREIAVDPQRVNPCLVAITQPNSISSVEYRNLRTTLLQRRKKQRLRSIVVASVAPGEGKSITALNLAWLLAQTEGVTALLIDGDLRLPSLNGYLGIGADLGLSHLLDGDAGLNDAIVKLEPAGLYLLPGGRVRHDVAELLSGPTFAGIIDEAVNIFDFVIIDAPPLNVFADAKILINGTDGALIVIRSNYTHYKTLGRIMEDLPAERLLGVVLNDSEETSTRGDYYDYRY
jgi:capsular exopolysaccharide synthesis family protein